MGGKQQHQALSALVSTASSSRSACSSPVEAHPVGRDIIHTIRIFTVSSCRKCASLLWHGQSKLVFSCWGVAGFLPGPFVPQMGISRTEKITEVLPQSAALGLQRRICKRGQQSCPHPTCKITRLFLWTDIKLHFYLKKTLTTLLPILPMQIPSQFPEQVGD